MPFVIGENVGSYRIVEPLGQGGMASVFKAYHAALDRYVAIKVLHLALNDDPNFTARFHREARVVARLDHPNIVPVFDFSEYEGQPYLVMKFIEGETLKARLLRGAVKHEDILPIVEAVGAALTYAHRMNVLHRDIKPANVLLTNSGQIYLADFGLAKMTDRDEASLTADRLEGTPLYISPEQALSKTDLDPRTDEYSFGVMVYEMIVGRVPFNEDSPLGTIHDHVYKPVPDPLVFAPDISEDLRSVLLKVLSKDRNDRFSNVAAFVRAFRAAFTGQPVIPEGSVIVQSSEDEQLVFVPPDAAENEPVLPPATQPAAPPKEMAATIPPTSLEDLPATVAAVTPASVLPPAQPTATSSTRSSAGMGGADDLPQAKKSSIPRSLAIGCAVVVGVALLVFLGFVVRGVLVRAADKSPTPTVTAAVTSPAPLVRQDLDAALAAWKKSDLPAAMRQLARVHLDIAGDAVAFNASLTYLQDQKAWLMAAIFVYTTDRPKLLESITSQIELIHEILYKAAADPLSTDFMTRNAGRSLFEVASIRNEVYFGDLQKAAADLNAVLANKVQAARFPEARLLQAELAIKQNDLAQAAALLNPVLNDSTLPDWIHTLAASLDQKINPK